MDKDAFLRQRRNLVSFSIALILVDILEASLGTATGSSTLSLFGGSFVFPEVNKIFLIGALWVGLFYFLWRYWIFGGRELVALINADLLDSYSKDNKYREYVLSKYRSKTLSKRPLRIKSNELSDEWKQEVGYEENMSVHANGLNKPLIKVIYKKAKLRPIISSEVIKHAPSFIKEPIHSIRILWSTFTKYTNFSEFLLPLILVTWAVIATLIPNNLWF